MLRRLFMVWFYFKTFVRQSSCNFMSLSWFLSRFISVVNNQPKIWESFKAAIKVMIPIRHFFFLQQNWAKKLFFIVDAHPNPFLKGIKTFGAPTSSFRNGLPILYVGKKFNSFFFIQKSCPQYHNCIVEEVMNFHHNFPKRFPFCVIICHFFPWTFTNFCR